MTTTEEFRPRNREAENQRIRERIRLLSRQRNEEIQSWGLLLHFAEMPGAAEEYADWYFCRANPGTKRLTDQEQVDNVDYKRELYKIKNNPSRFIRILIGHKMMVKWVITSSDDQVRRYIQQAGEEWLRFRDSQDRCRRIEREIRQLKRQLAS